MRRLIGFAVVMTGCYQPVSIGFEDAGVVVPADRMSLTGRFCTKPLDPGSTAVKVVLVLDQSGSMCVTDPPGAQSSGSFCQTALSGQGSLPSEPARVRALRQLIDGFRLRPEVSLMIVPFETNPVGYWPSWPNFGSFTDPQTYAAVMNRVSMLQQQLGKVSDLQGALAAARASVATDITRLSMQNPAMLPRTRYVVVVLTDGAPFPRCSGVDNLAQYATPDQPEGIWADSPGAETFCNTVSPTDPDMIAGFQAGGSRNQNAQLFSEVDQLYALEQANNVGAVRLHTVLMLDEARVAACGTVCQDIYGTYPGVPPSLYAQAGKKVATWTLQQLADRGHGTYSEYASTAAIANFAFTQDFSSPFAAPNDRNVAKGFSVRLLTSVPGELEREPDADGDGLADALETTTNAMNADSDGDCFDDGFEVRHATDGFDPMQKDLRGCDPASPLTPGCACRDTDGDGLSQFAENYLDTQQILADHDADGITDGVEVRWGLDPTRPLPPGQDTDLDGVSDAEEIRTGSDPTRADLAFRARHALKYTLVAQEQSDTTVCYDFTVENLQRNAGSNLVTLDLAEVPRGVPNDYGVWWRACATNEFAAGAKVATATLVDASFRVPSQIVGNPSNWRQHCVVAE